LTCGLLGLRFFARMSVTVSHFTGYFNQTQLALVLFSQLLATVVHHKANGGVVCAV